MSMEDDAQVSAELIIVLAALIAVALVLISGLESFSSEAGSRLDKEAEMVLDEETDIG